MLPNNVVDARPPANWEGSGTLQVKVSTELYRCERVSIGTFERANVTLAIQTHDNHTPPPGCIDALGGAAHQSAILQLFIASDKDLVLFFNQIGLPASFGEFEVQADVREGDLRAETWRISISNKTDSWLQRTHSQGPSIRNILTTRLFWEPPGGGISFLDFESSWRYANEPAPPVFGELNEPFLPGMKAYSGVGPLLANGTWVNAPFVHFGDFACE